MLRGFAGWAFALVDLGFVLVFDPADEFRRVRLGVSDDGAGSDEGVVVLLNVLGEGGVSFKGSEGCATDGVKSLPICERYSFTVSVSLLVIVAF